MENTENEWDGISNIQGKILRVATVENMPMNGFELQDGQYIGRGVAFEILRLLEQVFNFSHQVIPPRYNKVGPFEALQNGEVDMIAAMLPVEEPSQDLHVRYSRALASADWVILMKRPEESASGTGILAPFDVNVWLVTLVALVLIGPFMYAMMLIRRYICPKYASNTHRHVLPLSSCMWFAYSAIMKQGSTLVPANDLTRLLFATWWIFITILTSFYTANLTAFLTLSRFTLPIEDARGLAEESLRWVGRSGGPLEHAIIREDELSYLKESLSTGVGRILDLTDDEILELVMRDHVYLGEERAIERLVFRHYLLKTREGLDHKDRCTFVFTNKPFMVRPLAFAFPANSTLPKLFNPILQSMVEGGVIRHSLQLNLPSREICPLNLGNGERQLRNSDLLATYVVVVVGFCAALVAFLAEIATWNVWRVSSKSRRRSFHTKPLPFNNMILHQQKVNTNNKIKPHNNNKDIMLFYPRDFTIPRIKSTLLMDPHLINVHRVLNVKMHKPLHKRIAFTE